MNCLRNALSISSRLTILHRYCNPTQPSPAPPSRSDVLDSIRGLLFRPAKPAACSRTPAPSLPAAAPQSQPLIHLARSWYKESVPYTWKVAGVGVGAAVLLPHATEFTFCAAVSHKETVPYTNRTHRVVLSPEIERELGDELLEEIKKDRSNDILGPSHPNTTRVRRILSDIIRGIHDVFPTNGLGDNDEKQAKAAARPQTGHLRDLQWEVIVIRDATDSVYSLHGGKIVVFTGLLNSLETDAEIAAVIAHEAAHIVARHSVELTMLTPPILRELLPFSRRKELEADLIGMMLLAAAGFDPRVAPEVYEKYGEADTVLDDYLGSHPLGKKRARVLSQGDAMKEALELYYKQVCAGKDADRRFPYGGRISDTLMSE